MEKEITFATLGSVDAGKSTLIGTILSGKLDDGNGLNRKLVSRFTHEVKTGKTSAISTHSIKNFNKTDKSVIFVDLCGHRKYLKTTLFGVMGYYPDYAILIVGGNRGILEMTREHIKILYHLKIPMIVVITKTDLIDKLHEGSDNKKDGLTKITNEVKKIFSKGNFNVLDMNDIIENDKSTTGIVPNISTIPIFKLSCKTGYGLDYLKNYLIGLPRRIDVKLNKEINLINDTKNNENFVFQIETIYCPPGIGWVVTGILKSISENNFITPNINMYLGPSKYNNEYLQVKVWSIYNYFNEKVDKLFCGQRGCLAIRGDKKITRDFFRKGSILTNNLEIIKKASYTYRAKIKLLNHPTNVRDNFSPVIHSGTVRQCAKITILSKEISKKKIEKDDETETKNNTEEQKCIYPGDTAIIEIKFLYRPEIIESNQTFFLREGLTLGVGVFI
jgi:elongation factor 1-alpha